MGTEVAGKMPLTQEKPLDNNFTNNNDSSYLHKKFKKMASSIAVFPANQSIAGDTKYSDTNIAQVACNSLFSHGKITSSHEDLQRTTERQENHITYYVREEGKHVQISLGNENSSKNEKNNPDQVSGQTSFTDELSNKTEKIENDFIRDTHNLSSSGRYVCPYCKISCAKPSVLQKHIRAHTNERPYPCVPCGFAFKTKSNLYKHRRSRTHALRLQGSDVNAASNDDDLSGGSESDSSQPPTSSSDVGSDLSVTRHENNRLFEFSSPEVTNDRITPPSIMTITDCKLKTIYKPKFRAALYQENEDKDKIKKTISQNADFLTEHISKIISDNEAIVDVIETPLQKKYGKIKQIAESKQMQNDQIEIKSDPSPLNLTKNNNDVENTFRKRSHSESFPHNDNQKHPLNPEGSIIKDLLLKNKANGLISLSCRSEPTEGPVYICPVCQVKYVSADNLEIHRMYYCKTNLISNIVTMNNIQKDISNCNKRENLFTRSNSINVRLPEAQINKSTSPSYKIKPDNLIIKPECNDVIAPLPSPGPLLGNTRLVDSRIPADHIKKTENIKIKPIVSPKRKHDSSETYNTRLAENISPQITDMYQQAKIRCIDATSFRSVDELPHNMRQNSTSLQMFGGEVKIVDHSGGTTTLRIEPSKNQLSPITIQPTLSPSKLASDAEASSVVVRSGLHSGGTMVHNPPTPKEIISTPHTPRISLSNTPGLSNNMLSVHDITHFQFPPFNAITAFNPLTLPPLSPPISPNGTSTILHAGKLIPHVPGIPGPNTPGLFMRSRHPQPKNMCNEVFRTSSEQKKETTLYDNVITTTQAIKTSLTNKFEEVTNNRVTNLKSPHEKQHCNMYKVEMVQNHPIVPLIKVKPAEDPFFSKSSHNLVKSIVNRQDGPAKRSPEGLIKTLPLSNTSYQKYPPKCQNSNSCSSVESKADTEIRTFNFENLITKTEIYNNQVISSTDVQKNTNAQDILMTSIQNERSETAYFQKCNNTKTGSDERKTKFLRPTSLPLKPGTFTPKKHHGITPNANTMPLISPETPRPAKAYGQLYLNGNAYTYLGLKCSTKVFYCTINRPQPTYVPNQHFLSMYSNWQLLSELTPDPLGLSASSAMSLYDSRHRPQNVSVAVIKQDLILTHSSQWNTNTKVSKHAMFSGDSKRIEDNKAVISDTTLTPKKELTGGFESNEEYTYVRGRGRGRYVCSECGIRCKKPSMLKKHIRTHTDVRPYTCVHCAFSFKTKGNLTKHMKSKAHYKKCCELGINPNEGNESECTDISQCLGETDDDTESDGDEGNEGETESSDTEACKSQLPEHEAARCLLSLGCSRQLTPATPGLITSARPSTYPYTPKGAENSVLEIDAEKLQESNDIVIESKPELDSEPIDLSKNDLKVISSSSEIPTARESSVLASLASNTAKLPQHQNQWSNGEPMLHTYLTERALLDSKIKQSQLSTGLSKLKKVDLEKPSFIENLKQSHNTEGQINLTTTNKKVENSAVSPPNVGKDDNQMDMNDQTLNESTNNKQNWVSNNSGAENAKHVVSEYLKHARINLIKSRDDSHHLQKDNVSDIQSCIEENSNVEDPTAESDATFSNVDHDTVARKVVIGAGGVTFKFSKGKEFDTSYSPGRLMEDGRRVCDFCNKTFTKPSQLRLHLNIHYMERPFRCSACAVSFRTRGHLQKHERSGSHHNKVSMTSTFGAATSLNPRPFRCSDCNIAFRIHGHLAKHLRSKMHVMRLECLFKLPFGTFTEIERAGVSLTDIDTTDCESSLASLQSLARKLHEKDPTKLEYRDPNGISLGCSSVRESSEDDDTSMSLDKPCESERNDEKTIENSESRDNDISVNYSATDNIN